MSFSTYHVEMFQSYLGWKVIVSFRSDGKNQAKASRQPASVPRPVSSVTPPREAVSFRQTNKIYYGITLLKMKKNYCYMDIEISIDDFFII